MILRGQQFAKEDFPELVKVEPRIEELFGSLNALSKQLEAILNGGVGQDNLNSKVVELDIAASQTYPVKFASKVTGKPIGLRVLRAVKTTTRREGEAVAVAFGVDWSMDGDTVCITGLPGLSASDKYRITFELVGG